MCLSLMEPGGNCWPGTICQKFKEERAKRNTQEEYEYEYVSEYEEDDEKQEKIRKRNTNMHFKIL